MFFDWFKNSNLNWLTVISKNLVCQQSWVFMLYIYLGFFLLASDAFYELSRKVLKDEYLAYKVDLTIIQCFEEKIFNL